MLDRLKLSELHSLSDEVKKLSELSSELLRTAQDRYGHVIHKLVRGGKQVEAKESNLWTEVWHLGVGCEAGKLLATKHPEVFEAFKKQEARAMDLKKFCLSELGIDFTQMTISDYLRLTEEMFSLMIGEREGKPAFTMEIGEPPEGGNGKEPETV